MFGYVQINAAHLSDEQLNRYRSYYCGLCSTIGECHGTVSRLTLTYDMTFLAIFLSSLYEPHEMIHSARCIPHPGKKHEMISNPFIRYAADMNVYLTYYKLYDDWIDEHNPVKGGASLLFRRKIQEIELRFPRQCKAINDGILLNQQLEHQKADADSLANAFGSILSELFVFYENDPFQERLRQFGMKLGKYVYLADAFCDLSADIRHNRFNPLQFLNEDDKMPENMLSLLRIILGEATAEFESLPMLKDTDIIRNILYSGIMKRLLSHGKNRSNT